MPNNDEPQLLVTLESRGYSMRGIKSYSLKADYTMSTDAFSFEVYDDDRDALFGLEMEPVELSITNDAGTVSQMLGRIEISEPGEGLARKFSGRDYLCDLVECHTDPTMKVKDEETLGSIITLAASVCGIDTVVSDGDISMRNIRTGKSIAAKAPPVDFREFKLKEFKPNVGEGIFEFLNRIAARHGATIQPSDSRDTVVLTAPNFNQESTFTLRRTLTGSGNIKGGFARRNYSNVPTVLFSQGKFGSSTETRTTGSLFISIADLMNMVENETGKVSAAAQKALDNLKIVQTGVGVNRTTTTKTPRASVALNANNATQFSGEIAETLLNNSVITRTKPGTKNDPLKAYRFHYIKDEQSRTIDQLQSASKRRFSELAKNCLTYSCTVSGHVDPKTGAFWAIDTMADVYDEIERVDEKMWIHSREFRFSKESGAETDLELWLPNTFNI